MDDIIKQIHKMKLEKKVAILAHYYTDPLIHKLADYIGDSYYLSKIATEVEEDTLIICGVYFMGESAKILNPEKRIIVPDIDAKCPLANMISYDRIKEIRKIYEDVAVVCYINSTAEIKAASDICVTSVNAVKIVQSLPNQNIFFIPDGNLGRYVASKVPEKNIIINDGFCPVHIGITRECVEKAKQINPHALIVTHPECTWDVLEIADYIGSTSDMIEYIGKSDAKEFIICTEAGILYELELHNPDKRFYLPSKGQICSNMKRITVQKILECLENRDNVVEVKKEVSQKAYQALSGMLYLAN